VSGGAARRVRAGVMGVLAAAVVLLALGVARPSTASLHVLQLGPYSPFRIAYLSALVACIAGAVTWLWRGRLVPGPGTFVLGSATAIAAAAALAGYVDAIALGDATLIRLPPSDQTEDVPLAAMSFIRVTMVYLGALVAGILAAVWALRGGAEDLGRVAARSCVVVTLAVRVLSDGVARLIARAPAAAVAAFTLLALVVHVTGFRFVAADAAAFWIVGRIVLEGGLPYRDLWDVKYPGIHYISAALAALERAAAAAGVPFGVAAGVAETAVMVATVLVFHRVARELLPRPVALGVTALFAVIALDPILSTGGHLTETYVLLPGLLATRCALRVLRGPASLTALAGIGAWSAVASMIRPPAMAPVLVFIAIAWVAVLRAGGGSPARRAVRATLVAGGAFALPWLALLGGFARLGILDDFVEIPLGFNGFIAGTHALSNRLAQAVLAATYVAGLLPAVIVAAALVVRARRGDMRVLFVLGLALVELVGVVAPGRVKYGYVLEAAPVLCLLLGLGLRRLRPAGPSPSRATVAAVGLVLLCQLAAGYVIYLARPQHMVSDNDSVMPAAAYLKAHTRPGERALVVSRQPEVIHYHADRLPVSRFLYLEDSMVAYTRGGALAEIRDGLARVRPSLALVDATRRGWGPQPTFIERAVLPYLDAHYESVGVLETPRITYRIYRPRSAPAS